MAWNVLSAAGGLACLVLRSASRLFDLVADFLDWRNAADPVDGRDAAG